MDRGSLAGADQRRAAPRAVELGASLAQLHFGLEALDFQPDATFHHLGLAGEAFLGDAHLDARLVERCANATRVRALHGEQGRAGFHPLPRFGDDARDPAGEWRGHGRERARAEGGAAEIASLAHAAAWRERLDGQELPRRIADHDAAARRRPSFRLGALLRRGLFAARCNEKAKREREDRKLHGGRAL
jgi:hypothetical protein